MATRPWLTRWRKPSAAVSLPCVPKPGQTPDPALGRVIRELRERRGTSREALAYESGVTISSLAEIELGRANPSWATVKALAAALGTSMADVAARAERG